MRDPDLVQHAEQAAADLEQAWIRWRTRHGFGSGPLPPVSSYVGYSVEEPWGQPRVVFGVAADEAERFAAILDGHECVAPGRGLPGRPEPARVTAPVPAMPDSRVPMQAPSPGNGTGPVPPADERAESAEAEAEHLEELAARSASRPPMAQAFPAAPMLPAASQARTPVRKEAVQAGKAGGVARRSRTDASDQPEPDQAESLLVGSVAGRADQSAADQPGRTRLLEVPTVSRTRRPVTSPAPADASRWQRGEPEAAPTDTAV